MNRKIALVAAAISVPFAVGFTAQDVKVDPNLPRYSAVSGVDGSLTSVGSDTLGNMMTLWGDAFKNYYPNVSFQSEAKGSSTAPPALMENQSQFGPMSRAMKDSEKQAFVDQFGYEPTQLRVAIDCIAVYVHKDNPLDEISIDELVRVFSVAGGSTKWGDLGVENPSYRNRNVALYGRNSASGTYEFFKNSALQGNDYKTTVREQPGSAGVIQAVSSDRYGMGYSGIGYRTPGVKVLAVSAAEGEEAYMPTLEAANDGNYPIARFLYVYVNYNSREGLDTAREEFIRMMYSQQGQEVVIKDGAYPLTLRVATEELNKVGLEPRTN